MMLTDVEITELTHRRMATAEETAAFVHWLEREHNTDVLPKDLRGKLFGQAWNEGHAHGYGEVVMVYGDLAELALAAYEAGRQV